MPNNKKNNNAKKKIRTAKVVASNNSNNIPSYSKILNRNDKHDEILYQDSSYLSNRLADLRNIKCKSSVPTIMGNLLCANGLLGEPAYASPCLDPSVHTTVKAYGELSIPAGSECGIVMGPYLHAPIEYYIKDPNAVSDPGPFNGGVSFQNLKSQDYLNDSGYVENPLDDSPMIGSVESNTQFAMKFYLDGGNDTRYKAHKNYDGFDEYVLEFPADFNGATVTLSTVMHQVQKDGPIHISLEGFDGSWGAIAMATVNPGATSGYVSTTLNAATPTTFIKLRVNNTGAVTVITNVVLNITGVTTTIGESFGLLKFPEDTLNAIDSISDGSSRNNCRLLGASMQVTPSGYDVTQREMFLAAVRNSGYPLEQLDGQVMSNWTNSLRLTYLEGLFGVLPPKSITYLTDDSIKSIDGYVGKLNNGGQFRSIYVKFDPISVPIVAKITYMMNLQVQSPLLVYAPRKILASGDAVALQNMIATYVYLGENPKHGKKILKWMDVVTEAVRKGDDIVGAVSDLINNAKAQIAGFFI